MSEPHSTASTVSRKPAKPYPEFPLTAHPAGYWCKKIRGRIVYFGKWDDPDGALQKYLEQKDALHAGRTQRPDPDALTVKDLCNQFLNLKQQLVDSGELSPRTWTDYKDACDALVGAVGKQRLLSDLAADDFTSLRTKMAKKWGPHRLAKTVQCVRSAFKFAYDAGLIPTPLRSDRDSRDPARRPCVWNGLRMGRACLRPGSYGRCLMPRARRSKP